jgi:poly-beta-1,6-N-acetyl-D-glucosamine synthase
VVLENRVERISYVLITPARNEEASIGDTIESVISQTVLPKKWVIVSDGSTDRTDAIVREHLSGNPWIDLIRMPEHRDRQFAAKVNSFNAGYAGLRGVDYDIIGNLDADISFEPDYFEFLLSKFYSFEREIHRSVVKGKRETEKPSTDFTDFIDVFVF